MKSILKDSLHAVRFFYRCNPLNGIRKEFFLLILVFSISAHAGPGNVEDFDSIHGGLTNIEDGAIVEGSIRNGGLQPDYKIDITTEPLAGLMTRAEAIGKENIQFWQKVDKIVYLIKYKMFKYKAYDFLPYLSLLKRYRVDEKDIPLSEYVKNSAGVCREHALVLHFALKAAGIKNFHAYAQVFQAGDHGPVLEDHAFVVVNYENEQWVVDAYNQNFNGYRYKDLLENGVVENSPRTPFAQRTSGVGRIIKIHKFPTIYNPKISNQCSQVFGG